LVNDLLSHDSLSHAFSFSARTMLTRYTNVCESHRHDAFTTTVFLAVHGSQDASSDGQADRDRSCHALQIREG
jgi:hypothetical protein